jgi:phage-related protein
MKPISWCGDSRSRVRAFPEAARRKVGHELNQVQQGREPEDWKPMPSVGVGVSEIRVHAEGAHRVLYVAKFEEAVYVLHAFRKKTRQTAKPDLELASERYRWLVEWRKRVRQ